MHYRQCYTHPGSYDPYLGLNKLYGTLHLSLSFFLLKPSVATLTRNITHKCAYRCTCNATMHVINRCVESLQMLVHLIKVTIIGPVSVSR